MSAAHAHLTEDAPAPYLVVSKKAYEPNTENLILSARGLHPGPKSVLAHICQLHEHGGQSCYNANNQYIATALGITEPMVSRHIHALAERGLLTITPRANGQRRVLTPTPALQSAYRNKSVAEITEVVKSASESGKMSNESGKNSESGKMPGESGKKHFTEVVKTFYRSGKHIKSLLEEKEILSSRVGELETENAELLAANAAQKEKIERLEAEALKQVKRIEKSVELFREQERQLTELKAQPPTTIVAGPAAKPAKAPRPKSQSHPFTESPYASLEATIAGLTGTDYEHADIPYYHEMARNWSESKGEKKANWLATIRSWMLRDSRENKLKTNPNSTPIPNADAANQHREHIERHGLIDHDKRRALAAELKAMGL